MSIALVDRMSYFVCLIHENAPTNPQSYPYKDTALLYDHGAGVLRFPEQTGDPEEARTSGFSNVSSELRLILSTIPSDREYEVIGIAETNEGAKILMLLVRDSRTLPPDPTIHTSLQEHNTFVRAIMDEVRQGRVCHARIHSSVRDLFFSHDASKDIVPPSTPYFYEPASDFNPTPLALVRAPSDTSPAILHSPDYYRIPMIGYHGTSETFVENAITEGLRPTKRNGMYGNDAYYFGSFYKAIRYAFRDSGYAEMPQKSSLYKTDRPAGFWEVPNTAHINPKTKEIRTDLIRDSPALVRFVLFTKSPVFMPQNARSLENKDSPKRLRSLPARTVNSFVNYRKTPSGGSKTIYSRDYLISQVGEPLFKDGSSGVDITVNEDDDLTVPSDSSREETTLRLYRAIHVATRPAFA
jgi:hypothetical protein